MIRDQERAQLALTHVRSVQQDAASVQEAYGSLCQRLPSLLHTSGLLQTLAFMEARSSSKGHFEHLLGHLAGQLGHQRAGIVETVANADTTRYVWLAREAQRCLVWYKRFAESVLGVTSAEGDE